MEIFISMISNKEISNLGIKEKYIRKKHYNTLKVWWARRPLVAMRALLINEVLRKSDKNIDKTLLYELNPSKYLLKNFSEEFTTKNLKVLDIFAGGASIPFESARLGFQTYASELNPVASLLQETIFESSIIPDYAQILKDTAYKIIDQTEKRLEFLFDVGTYKPYTIFWGRLAKCKNCNQNLSLSRLDFLVKKKHKNIRIIQNKDCFEVVNNLDKKEKLAKDFICKNCQTKHSFKDIKEFCQDNILASEAISISYHDKNGKKQYKGIDEGLKQIILEKEERINTALEELKHLIPDENFDKKSGVVNPTLYDLKQPKDFFNSRQLLILLTLIDEIIKEYQNLTLEYESKIAKQIILGLTSLIEFLVDWNSKSTMWIAQNEQTGRSLAGPGVAMKWDYIEVNPFYWSGSNLRSKIDRVAETFQALYIQNEVTIFRGSSANLDLADKEIDFILTDPPYYDSIDYTALSEFFRPWFEVLIQNTFDKNISLKNNTSEEAIVALDKQNKQVKNESHYQEIMQSIWQEAYRVLKDKGVALMLYSHKTFEGWKVIAEVFKNTNFFVESVIPLEMERIARPRAMNYQALNGVVIFRFLKSKENIKTIEDDLSNLKNQLEKGEILESQIVIYLAGLACKHFTLSENLSFEECYEKVKITYEEMRLKYWLNGSLDTLSKSYLLAKLQKNIYDLPQENLEVLEENNLVNEGKLLQINEFKEVDLENSLLSESYEIFKTFEHNTKTKVKLDKNLEVLFSILAGTSLNTTSQRSANTEEKIARLILSKAN